jgi:hypothetical protein
LACDSVHSGCVELAALPFCAPAKPLISFVYSLTQMWFFDVHYNASH